MFSMSLRQLGKMNLGQSFGRDSNDLNALARLGLRGRKSPRAVGGGALPGSGRSRRPGPGNSPVRERPALGRRTGGREREQGRRPLWRAVRTLGERVCFLVVGVTF